MRLKILYEINKPQQHYFYLKISNDVNYRNWNIIQYLKACCLFKTKICEIILTVYQNCPLIRISKEYKIILDCNAKNFNLQEMMVIDYINTRETI